MKRPQRRLIPRAKVGIRATKTSRKKFYPFGRGTKGYRSAEDYNLAFTQFSRSNLATSEYYLQIVWMKRNGVSQGRIQRYINQHSKNPQHK